MDRLIKPGTDTNENRFRKHRFAAIDTTAQAPGRPPSPSSSPTFKSGLITTPAECASLSEMGNMLLHEKSNTPSQNRRPPHFKEDDNHQPVKGGANAAENQATPACIWEQFGSALQAFEKEENKTFEQAAAETVNLSLAISEKMLGTPSGIDLKEVHGLVEAAWQDIKQEQVVHFSISPHDLEVLKQVDPDAACPEDTGAGYVFHENASLEDRTLMVEGPPLDMQPTLSKQLALIEQNFITCFQEQPESGHTDQTATTEDGSRSKYSKPYRGMP